MKKATGNVCETENSFSMKVNSYKAFTTSNKDNSNVAHITPKYSFKMNPCTVVDSI